MKFPIRNIAFILFLPVDMCLIFGCGHTPTAPGAVHVTQAPIPKRPIAPLDTAVFLQSLQQELVAVKGGTFLMGSDSLHEDSRPVHTVTVGDFYIGKYPVTLNRFRTFVSATGYITSGERAGGAFVLHHADEFAYKTGTTWECDERGAKRTRQADNYPVLFVSWNDADSFCHWLSAISGQTYRLPTEAEWEFACTGGNKSKHYAYSGSNRLNDVAWYGLNSDLRVHPVGQKQPNELGLYDMTGSVWEWCGDWYGANYYATSPTNNPTGPAQGKEKICRGGCYLSGLETETFLQCHPAYRGKDEIHMAANAASFRIVREL